MTLSKSDTKAEILSGKLSSIQLCHIENLPNDTIKDKTRH